MPALQLRVNSDQNQRQGSLYKIGIFVSASTEVANAHESRYTRPRLGDFMLKRV